jgi:hypothetical protein
MGRLFSLTMLGYLKLNMMELIPPGNLHYLLIRAYLLFFFSFHYFYILMLSCIGVNGSAQYQVEFMALELGTMLDDLEGKQW